ncbi:MepB family protein [Sphingobacterium detergens]
MIKELKQLGEILSKTITNLTEDEECAGYFGFNFQLDERNIKFRKAKITPTKVGQFVTLWKRDAQGQTTAFTADDAIDYYIIATEQQQNAGLFVFPKQVLIDRQILTTAQKEGKRGFRVYPDWSITQNKQATHSKNWQGQYFIDLRDPIQEIKEKLIAILQIS